MRLASIDCLEFLQPIKVEQSESGVFNRPQVAPTPLYGKNALRPASKRIGQLNLRTGVAAAEIGDSQIRAQQVRTVPQQGELISRKGFCLAIIPEIFEVSDFRNLRHRLARSTAESAPPRRPTCQLLLGQRLPWGTTGR